MFCLVPHQIITTIVKQGGLKGWPSIVQHLTALLNHQDPNCVDGAFSALNAIAED